MANPIGIQKCQPVSELERVVFLTKKIYMYSNVLYVEQAFIDTSIAHSKKTLLTKNYPKKLKSCILFQYPFSKFVIFQRIFI